MVFKVASMETSKGLQGDADFEMRVASDRRARADGSAARFDGPKRIDGGMRA